MGLTVACCLVFTSSFSSSVGVCVAVLLSLGACDWCEGFWQ